VRIGIFELESSVGGAGIVSLTDLTGEDGKQIAFDAIRWRRVVEIGDSASTSDGYDQPVGTEEDRRADKVWGGEWLDASPFGKLYFVGTSDEAYHTGADLNLLQNADAHTPVYAAASGQVIYSGKLPVWGNVIIIKHDPLEADGLVLYGRYAHVENVILSVGQHVSRGEQIANVGDAFGRWAYLLHFDLSPTTILERSPGHWVGMERDAVYKNYIDPREFIERNRPK
jgi:murein DD-endopeptidase MepM/ murein hydrolase activator NlpD